RSTDRGPPSSSSCRAREYDRGVDRKRDAPIPWSVSLPCVVALGALLFGWHSLATPSKPAATEQSDAQARSTPPVRPEPAPAPAPEPKQESKAETSSSPPPPTAPPASTPAPDVEPAPIQPSAPASASKWLPLETIGAADLLDGANASVSRA